LTGQIRKENAYHVMKVTVEVGGRWANNLAAKDLFLNHKTYTEWRMSDLSKMFKVRPPRRLLLKPYYFRGSYSKKYGRVEWDSCTGYVIRLSVPDCLAMLPPDGLLIRDKATGRKWIATDAGRWVIDHELCHIICRLKYGHLDATHNGDFMVLWDAVFETGSGDFGVSGSREKTFS
jgi:hypothetical protein